MNGGGRGPSGLLLRPGEGGAASWRFPVRVQPRASRNALVGVEEGALRIRLTAPPVEGEANRALVRFLAEALGLRPAQVRLVAGGRSRRKWVEVEGLSAQELTARLGAF